MITYPRHDRTLIGFPAATPGPRVIRVFGAAHYEDRRGRHFVATGCGHLYPVGNFSIRLSWGSRVAPSKDGEWLRWDGQGLASVTDAAGAEVVCHECVAWRRGEERGRRSGLAMLGERDSEDEETGMILRNGLAELKRNDNA